MNTDRQDPHAYPIALPPLSDDALVEIRNFIEHLLDQFDLHYAAQVRRFYEDRAEAQHGSTNTARRRRRRPAVLKPSCLNVQRRQAETRRRSCSRM